MRLIVVAIVGYLVGAGLAYGAITNTTVPFNDANVSQKYVAGTIETIDHSSQEMIIDLNATQTRTGIKKIKIRYDNATQWILNSAVGVDVAVSLVWKPISLEEVSVGQQIYVQLEPAGQPLYAPVVLIAPGTL